MTTLYLFLIVLMALTPLCVGWTYEIKPKLQIKYDSGKYPAFFGNITEFFKVLDTDDNSMLVGARNAVYNISFHKLHENPMQRIEWSSSEAHQELCTLKGKSRDADCQNFIRVFARISDKQIMVCGTNSYKPSCRYYNLVPSEENDVEIYEFVKNEEAQGRCPYNPMYNSTYIYTDGLLYSATAADFGGANPLIHCEIQPNISLKTDGSDMKQLNQPSFVNALEYNGYVLFFFREQAMEYMNCGKAVYSRVGRVCKNDKGGPYPFQEKWTSFLKTRLNCSMPSEFPFYFDEIQATSKLIDGIYGNDKESLIYVVMSTPTNAIDGSAICVYSADDILKAFEGRFKGQKTLSSNWLPIDPAEGPRPGECVDDSRTLPSSTVNFIKKNPLMEQSVNPIHGMPLLIDTTPKYKFSAITVDPQVETVDGKIFDVIYLGTFDGKLVKFINLESSDSKTGVKPFVISDQQVLPFGTKVKELHISKKTQSIVLVGDSHIVSVPYFNCNTKTSCSECLELKDPHCAWDGTNRQCVFFNRSNDSGEKYFQNVKGHSTKSICQDYDQYLVVQPPTPVKPTHGTVSSIGEEITYDGEIPDTYDDSDYDGKRHGVYMNTVLVKDQTSYDSQNGGDNNSNLLVNKSSMNIIVVVGLVTLLIGVLFGYIVSRHVMLRDNFPTHHSFHYGNGPDSLQHRNQLNWQQNSKTPILALGGARNNGGKDINLLMNTNTNQATINNKKDNLELEFGLGSKDRSHECKNSTESLDKDCKPPVVSTGTLQKVKKTYI